MERARILRGLWAVAAAGTIVAIATPAGADIATPTTLQVFFSRDDKPFEKPVDFAIVCRGWMTWPGRSNPAPTEPRKIIEVYRIAAKCPAYGCEVPHNLYLNYRHIEFCEASGTAGGKAFRIGNIGTSPVGECAQPSREGKFEQRCTLRLALPK